MASFYAPGSGNANFPATNGYDGIIDGDMVYNGAQHADFELDVYPETLTNHIKFWSRSKNACNGEDNNKCKLANNRHTSIFLNDDSVECTARVAYGQPAITTALNSGDSLYFDCPVPVSVYNMRITNNGFNNILSNAQFITWAKVSFQEVQLAIPRGIVNTNVVNDIVINTMCIVITCTCANGVGAIGTACPTNESPLCVSCNEGFVLDSGVCNADFALVMKIDLDDTSRALEKQ